MPLLFEAYPRLLTLVLLNACPTSAQLQQHEQHPPPQAPGSAAEGSLEHTHALGCLHILAASCKEQFWHLPGLIWSPEELVQQLESICWRQLRNEQLLRLMLKVLQALAESLLPCCAPAQDEDDDEAAAAAAAGCKMAVGMCLRLLLVTLPGSSQVPLLIRGLALQVGNRFRYADDWPAVSGAASFAVNSPAKSS
jgi:hypothetical protein